MASLDPTGIVSALVGIAAQKFLSLIHQQRHYKDRAEELMRRAESWRSFVNSEPEALESHHRQFHNDVVTWSEETNVVYERSRRKTSCWSRRREIFKDIDKQLKKLEEIEKEAWTLHYIHGKVKLSTTRSEPLQPAPPSSQLVGVERRLRLLSASLFDDSSPKWIGISAMGGAGKTLLARTTFNNKKTREEYKERLWITVGRERSVEVTQQTLLMAMGKRDWRVTDKHDGKSSLFNLLQGHKALLVLDDVWNYDVLEWLDVVDEKMGSKILITTRNKRVLESVKATQIPFDLLSDEESWRLFSISSSLEELLSSKTETKAERLISLANDIIRQCKGLPLALRVIGKAMASRTKLWQWEQMFDKLEKARRLDREEEDGLFEVMRVSYDELGSINDRGALYQRCFLDMAAFPEDEQVPVDKLVAMWRAIYHESQQAVMDILYQLENRYLLQSSFKDCAFPMLPKTKHYSVHDVLRDLAVKLSGNTSLLAARKGMNQEDFEATAAKQDITNLQMISIQENEITSLSPIGVKGTNLCALLIDENRRLTNMDNGVFDNFDKLQVLSASKVPIENWPKALGSFKDLRLLEACGSGFSGHIKLGNISELTKLEFLHTNFFISRNLEFLGNFTSLTHLSIEEYFVSVPNNALARLVSLKTLDLNLDRVEDITPALYCFKNLERLRLWYKGEETSEFWLGIFQISIGLKFLCLRNGNKHQEKFSLDHVPAMLPKLKVFYFNNPWVLSLPSSLGQAGAFSNLQKLDLKCKGMKSLPALSEGALTKLVTLSILDFEALQCLPESWRQLPNLEMLELRDSPGLTTIMPMDFHISSFQMLRSADLSGTKISALPVALLRLPHLQYLDIRNCSRLHPDPQLLQSFPKICIAHSGLGPEDLKKELRKCGLRISDTLACALEHDY